MTEITAIVRTKSTSVCLASTFASVVDADHVVLTAPSLTSQIEEFCQRDHVTFVELLPSDCENEVPLSALNMVKTEWVVIVHGNEQLSLDAIEILRGLLTLTTPEFSAWSIPLRDESSTQALRSAENTFTTTSPRVFRVSDILLPDGPSAFLHFAGEIAPLDRRLGVWLQPVVTHSFAEAVDEMNERSTLAAQHLLETREIISMVRAIQQGARQFSSHFHIGTNDGFTFNQGFLAFAEEVITAAKALEHLGWNEDALLPSPHSMEKAFQAFSETLAHEESMRIRSHVARAKELGAGPKDCAIALEMLTEFYGPDPDTLCDLACRYFDAGDIRGALATIEQGFAAQPGHPGLTGVLNDIQRVIRSDLPEGGLASVLSDRHYPFSSVENPLETRPAEARPTASDTFVEQDQSIITKAQQ